MSMLAGMMGGSGAAGAGGAAAGGSAAGTGAAMAGGSAASSGALSGALGSAYAAPAAASIGTAAPAMSAAAAPSMWSTLGSTMGQFGKDYAAGQANPYNTQGLGFNGQTMGQIAEIGNQGDSSGGNMLTSYLQQKQDEDRKRRGY